jgi:citrate lyase beta subunit
MAAETTLPAQLVGEAELRLARAQEAYLARYPGDGLRRQPVHTVYLPAQQFTADVVPRLGTLALQALEEHAPDAATFARAIGLPAAQGEAVYPRVVAKLRREPVEDLRIDFEDGYGVRPDREEDAAAVAVAEDVARAFAAGALPPCFGIRIKPMTAELGPRSMRTLDLFVTTLVRRAGELPPGFAVLLAKITSPVHVAVLADLLIALERPLGLAHGALKLELMIETPQCLMDVDGRSMLPLMLDDARGRCVAAHFGTYDYTAGSDVTAAQQRMRHPACDFAKQMMKVAFAGTGLWLADGSTIVLPVGERDAVHAAWRLHADDVRHSLATGFYQGWDLHPAQLPSRYGAVYGFYLDGLPAATERLRRFVATTAKAGGGGDIADEIATGQQLLGFFLRGLSCGALTEEEALATGLTLDELRGRSIAKVLRARRGGG